MTLASLSPDQLHQALHDAIAARAQAAALAIVQHAPQSLSTLLKARGEQPPTLLHAATQGLGELVTALLELGAPADVLDELGNGLLHHAVQSGAADLVQTLLQRRVALETRNRYGYRPLHWAAELGELAIARLLVERGAKVNVKTNRNQLIRETFTPLYLAARHGHGELARYLLDQGAEPNALNDSNHATALVAACERDDLRLIALLLQHGASANGVNKQAASPHPEYCNFPLASARSAEAVNLLVARGAEVNARNSNFLRPTSALRWMVAELDQARLDGPEGARALEAMRALLDHGASLDDGGPAMESEARCAAVAELLGRARAAGQPQDEARQHLGQTLYELAADCDTADKLAAFRQLASNADAALLNRQDYEFGAETILNRLLEASRHARADHDYRAPLAAYVDAAQQLLAIGADPRLTDICGDAALHKAAAKSAAGRATQDNEALGRLLQLLLEHGADPAAENLAEQTPATLLAGNLQFELLALLQTQGSGQAIDAALALFEACTRASEQQLDRLLAQATDLERRNELGDTLLLHAAQLNLAGFAARLLSSGADPQARDPLGRTALLRACLADACETLACLLEHGADVRQCDAQGNSALVLLLQNQRQFFPDREAERLYKQRLEQAASDLARHGADLQAVSQTGQTVEALCPTKKLFKLLQSAGKARA